MEDLSFLLEYISPIILGICLCLGYVLKNIVPSDILNNFIPAIMAVTGIAVSIWVSHSFNAEILLTGLVSGAASTGLHQAFIRSIEGLDKIFGAETKKLQ